MANLTTSAARLPVIVSAARCPMNSAETPRRIESPTMARITTEPRWHRTEDAFGHPSYDWKKDKKSDNGHDSAARGNSDDQANCHRR